MKQKFVRNTNFNNVILSDVLPYETPVIFSNRRLFDFLNHNKIVFNTIDKQNSFVSFRMPLKERETFRKALSLLLGANDGKESNSEMKINAQSRIAFKFKIQNKENSFRELSLPHPKTQIECIAFYEKYSALIQYYSSVSNFSIRRAVNIAKFKSERNELFYTDNKMSFSRTFFFVQKYPSIHRFYEGYHYQRAEKKFNKMKCFDVSKCFDSIYSHSLAWAIYGKDYVKKNLGRKIDNSFASVFDRFMQYSNNSETNGIIIGPEFSRIFAELILQKVDSNVEQLLANDCDKSYRNKRDYEMFRFVDDCFVFYNDDALIEKLLHYYEVELREFKMGFNESKTIEIHKPIITQLTIAKNEISRLLTSYLDFKVVIEEGKIKIAQNFKVENLITDYKTIIFRNPDIAYKDVLNYSLTVTYNMLKNAIHEYSSKLKLQVEYFSSSEHEVSKEKFRLDDRLTKYFSRVLEFTFFLHNVSPRVSPTIKVTNIISLILKSLKSRLIYNNGGIKTSVSILGKQHKERVKKKIYDELTLSLSRYQVGKNIQVETLYLMITMSQLGKDYRLTKNQLIKYLDLKINYEGKIEFRNTPNYFVCTTLLFYCKNSKDLEEIKIALLDCISVKIVEIEKNERKNYSELVLLFFDLIACPYINLKTKKYILSLFGIDQCKEEFINFVNREKLYFTTWFGFDLYDEIIKKKASESY